ncbi:MAG: hypothetical protein K8J31_09305 [Anaerolineae bacterium]|nr:hypothetical protein [Anaerolineae bacterium]
MNPVDELEQHYPEVIQRMGKRFNSHEFIRELAYQQQALYVQALAHYAHNKAPFQVVHGLLAKALHKFDHLVDYIGVETSTDIFGHSNEAAVWGRK